MLHPLVYVSAADLTLMGTDLQELLEQSRRHNAAHDITGLLLYRAGTFLQFLEGHEPVVERLYAAIAADERHLDVVLVRRRSQPAQPFPDWSTAYGDIDPTSTAPIAVQMPPPDGPAPHTADEARFILELLELLDLFDPRMVALTAETLLEKTAIQQPLPVAEVLFSFDAGNATGETSTAPLGCPQEGG